MGAAASWPPITVSAGIDLVVNSARRGEVGRAETLLSEVAADAERLGGWHGWLWAIRLSDARAEIALVRGDGEAARHWANETIEQSRARGRVKYEVRGLAARAQALIGLGRQREAVADLRAAVNLARPMGDPALFLRAAAALLAVEGDGDLAAEARAAVDRIVAALPHAEMRRCFEAAEPVRFVRMGRR
jgi:ATP/maltotriose-dependent transcriptional regulator MalT